jgi:hypothetical protein
VDGRLPSVLRRHRLIEDALFRKGDQRVRAALVGRSIVSG